MHICIVSREYPPNYMGGIGTYVVNMTRILVDSGHRVSIITQWHPDAPKKGKEPFVSDEDRLKVYYLPFVTQDWTQLLPEAARPESAHLLGADTVSAFGPVVSDFLFDLMQRDPADVIEAQEYEAPTMVYLSRRQGLENSHPLWKIPVIVHLHSPSHMIFEWNDDEISNPSVAARRNNEFLNINLADAILAPSQYLAEQVKEWTGVEASKVSVIPYPIGPLLKYPQRQIPEDGRILFVGRVEPRKGAWEFIEAATRIAKDFPDAYFRFVGGPHHRLGDQDSEETANLVKRLIPDELKERFHFVGKVPRETLGEEYRRAQITAIPSRWDNYPNTCMEAMSCASPILCTNQGGMAEMVEHSYSGYIAECKLGDYKQQVDALEQGLRSLLSNDRAHLVEIGKDAQRRILHICDDQKILQKRIEHFSTLVKKQSIRAKHCKKLSSNINVFSHKEIEPKVLNKTIQSIELQSQKFDQKHLFSPVKHLQENWKIIDTHKNDPTDGWGIRKGVISDNILDNKAAKVQVFVTPGIELKKDYLKKIHQAFTTNPHIGACTIWSEGSDGDIHTHSRFEAFDFLKAEKFPEIWAFRTESLKSINGLEETGFYFNDILRDCILRLHEKGWIISQIAENLALLNGNFAFPVLGEFTFAESKDSQRAICLAHERLLRKHLKKITHHWLE